MKHNHGYILLWRGWMEHPVLTKGAGPFSRREAWVWLIEHAAWDNHDDVDRDGPLHVSQRFLASAWNWSKTSVRRFLLELSEAKMIKIWTDGGSKTDHLTICNYSKYQKAWTGNGPSTPPFSAKMRTKTKTKTLYPPSVPLRGDISPPSLRSEGESARRVSKSVKARKGRVNGHRLSPAEKLFAGFAAAAGYDSLADFPLDEPLLDDGRSPRDPPRSGRRLDR